MYYWYWIEEFYRDIEWDRPINDLKPKAKVVAATIKSPLSRKREPENDPVRLELVIQVQVTVWEIKIIS